MSADEFVTDLGRKLMNERPVSFYALYLPGMDIISRRVRRASPDRDVLDIKELSAQAEEYAAFVDDLVYEFTYRVVADKTTLLVVLLGEGEGDLPGGRIIILGPDVRSGEATEPVGLLDIAPTILALQGFPPAKDMPGRPVADRKSTRLNSRHIPLSRMPASA